MKTTVDIPDEELEAVMRFTRASTKREAIVAAIADYNRRRRMAALDIFAVRDNTGGVIECKYHSNGWGIPTDVKTALYVYSRFMDIKKAYELNLEYRISISKGWLVTNTRCSPDAIKYADCVGLKIVSWKYPHENSLERMIENKKLYPVTILSSIKKASLDILFKNDIMIVRDIAVMDEQIFIKQSGLDMVAAKTLKREADELCHNS